MPDCIVSRYPETFEKNEILLQSFNFFKDFVTQIRDIRNRNGLKQREELPVFLEPDS
jgi:valyl-tRNA synthetase